MEKKDAFETTMKIESLIYEIRGQKVMLDRDLAKLYGVTTGNLNKAVKRNIERFPERYMFQLTTDENLKFQNGISSWGGSRSLPYVFTEQGVAMLSSVLHSSTAIQVSISIIDAFVAIRSYIISTSSFSAELKAIKAKLELLERNDEDNLEAINDLSEDMRREIDTIYQAIAALSIKDQPENTPRPKIGFKTSSSK
jgi:DNA polymerase III delta prime subunit